MRIGHLINSLECGGAEQVVAHLAAEQARQGHFVRVICLRDVGSNPVSTAALTSAGGEVASLLKPEGLHFDTLRKLIRYMKVNRLDVLHTHNHLVHHYGALAGVLTRTRTVSTLHGSSSLTLAPRWTQLLYRFSCRLSDAVVGVCDDVAETLQRHLRLPPSLVHVVENGIDLSPFLSVRREAPSSGVVFGTMGRLEAIKDHSTLLQAFAAVKSRHPRVQLRILGDGSLRQMLEQQARELAMQDAVHFEGFSRDTSTFLGKLDVYVISSKSEGLPLSLLEALAAGLPVAATAVGAIPDVISRSQCGSLCPPSDPNELAACMEREMERAVNAGIAERARTFAASEYGIERMTRAYTRLYEEISRARASGAALTSP